MSGTTKTHGLSGTREYDRWSDMKSRCYNPTSTSYPRYGGRGIKVCSRWLGSFPAFLEDMGPCPDGMSLERKDSNRDYAPDNCCWATLEEQNNNRRSNRMITHDGVTLTLAQWARKLNMDRTTLFCRLRHHSPAHAFQPDIPKLPRKPMSRETKAKISATKRARFAGRVAS